MGLVDTLTDDEKYIIERQMDMCFSSLLDKCMQIEMHMIIEDLHKHDTKFLKKVLVLKKKDYEVYRTIAEKFEKMRLNK